jgi:hypothetical protein
MFNQYKKKIYVTNFSGDLMDLTISEAEKREMEGATKKDLTKKEKKELKRKAKSGDNEKDEKDEELKRLQKEVEEWKAKAQEMEKDKKMTNRALGFTVEEYMGKNYIEAARWIATEIKQAFKERMEERPEHFYWTKLVRGKYSMGARTCARFNRGEYCNNGKWHVLSKRTDDQEEPDKELRLHGCTLCLETLGIWSVHPVVDCQWLFERTWTNLGK